MNINSRKSLSRAAERTVDFDLGRPKASCASQYHGMLIFAVVGCMWRKSTEMLPPVSGKGAS